MSYGQWVMGYGKTKERYVATRPYDGTTVVSLLGNERCLGWSLLLVSCRAFKSQFVWSDVLAVDVNPTEVTSKDEGVEYIRKSTSKLDLLLVRR